MKLEDFINENRADFDNKQLPKHGQIVFKQQLKQQLHATPKRNQFYSISWKVAASILLLIVAYTFGKVQDRSDFSNDSIALKSENLNPNEIEVLSLMGNSSPHKRIAGINHIEKLTELDEAVLNALIDRLLHDQNDNVRFTALRGLEEYIDMEAVKTALIQSLGSEGDTRIQISVIHQLVAINEKRAIEPIQALLDKEQLEPRGKAHINALLLNLI